MGLRETILPLLTVVVLAGCSLASSSADSVTRHACTSLNAVTPAVAQIANAANEVNATDVQKHLTLLSAKLDDALAGSTGVTQTSLDPVRALVVQADKQISALNPDTPLSELPPSFADQRRRINASFNSAYSQLNCS